MGLQHNFTLEEHRGLVAEMKQAKTGGELPGVDNLSVVNVSLLIHIISYASKSGFICFFTPIVKQVRIERLRLFESHEARSYWRSELIKGLTPEVLFVGIAIYGKCLRRKFAFLILELVRRPHLI